MPIPAESTPITEAFQFTNDWFGVVKGVWEELVPQIQPQRMLEIGSYEGASACYSSTSWRTSFRSSCTASTPGRAAWSINRTVASR
ncbi:hypothetical protein [Variovorax boronicumulans]|uniref:hypothetical protein n=1 Tax=Variovorax boronicumulans TaxID=436515 RepID=UPI0027834A75|nr:hypothetical protein [Variovorax boronicumulans]MDQ0041819.1 hypothetical protein [Variovorax boronicumulans]